MNPIKIIALVFILIAGAIALHQYIGWGYWFEWGDLHHETWMIMFAFCGIVLFGVYGRSG